MTEFISRNFGNERFEIIIKTTSPEHYKEIQDFARQLIDHAKPGTDKNVGSKWIPVSERLPDANEKVVCRGSEGGVFIAETRYLAGRVLWNDLARFGRRKATHWMPLPKPPKGDK